MTTSASSTALSTAYDKLLLEAGGTWPAKPLYQFPEGPLQTLHELCLQAPNVFAKTMDLSQVSADDISPNRQWLEERLPPAIETLDALKSLDQNQLLSISATVMILSHFYRWATIPTLTAAQNDLVNTLPYTLSMSMLYLNAHLGILTTAGTVTTAYYNNWNHNEDRLEYMITKNFDQAAQDAEHWTAKLFVVMEGIAAPFYHCLGTFAADLEAGRDSQALEPGIAALKAAFAYFYKNLKPEVVKKDVWARYVQGFYGWAWDGREGVSGNQAFMIRMMDAVLGIPNPVRPTHLSGAQRSLVWTAYDADLRKLAAPYPQASKSLNDLVRMLKMWRLGHSKKAYYYEDVELPERKPMTGGYGTDADVGLSGMLERMSVRLKNRTQLTV